MQAFLLNLTQFHNLTNYESARTATSNARTRLIHFGSQSGMGRNGEGGIHSFKLKLQTSQNERFVDCSKMQGTINEFKTDLKNVLTYF